MKRDLRVNYLRIPSFMPIAGRRPHSLLEFDLLRLKDAMYKTNRIGNYMKRTC